MIKPLPQLKKSATRVIDSLMSDKKRSIALLITLTLGAIVILRSAWLCDDAFITFRCVDNFITGHGLTWNPGERVQAFTHPLWALTLSLPALLTGEIYFTSIILSIAITLSALVIALWRKSVPLYTALLTSALLLVSKPFIDFAASGLENPLTYLCIAVFIRIYLERANTSSALRHLTLVVALAMMNRLDTVLLLGPALLYLYIKEHNRLSAKDILIGFSPLVAWMLFATLYYGFPLPNTAYAKLNTGIARADLIDQGLVYLNNIWSWEPVVTLTAALALILSPLFYRKRLPLIAGVLLYLLYTISVGGDFMSGRFLAVPFFLTVCLLAGSTERLRYWRPALYALYALIAIMVVIGGVWSTSPIRCGSDYGTAGEELRWDRGISDERAGYYQKTGLLTQRSEIPPPNHSWAELGRELKAESQRFYRGAGIGMIGYFAGPETYVLDYHALTDPLLSRLPSNNKKNWRIGHFARDLPEGYWESITSDSNLLIDTNLVAYYEVIRTLTRESVFSLKRLKTLLQFNLGSYNYLIQRHIEASNNVRYKDFNTAKRQGTTYNAKGCKVFDELGFKVLFETPRLAVRIEISVDHNDDYLLTYYREGDSVASAIVQGRFIAERGLRVDTVLVPDNAASDGFDAIRILGQQGDGKYSVGHLRLLE